jgi:CxxC-x17-CxxC domain-containing protein
MGDFNRNFRRSGRNKFNRRGSGRFSRRDRDRDRPSEMHSAICDKCGKDCEVPFKPTQGKPIYCSDCFRDKSREAGSRSGFGKPSEKPSNENFDQINKKLDRILSILESAKKPVEKKPEFKKPEEELLVLEEPKIIKKKKPKKKKS